MSTACSTRLMEGAPPGWAPEENPPYLADRVRLLANDGERNWVLHLNEIATASLRRGDRETAKRALDEAILQIEVIYGNSEQARQARSLWRSEGRKVFKGDPYERSMVFFYRGVLYMQDRDWDNARACFRSALYQDSIAEEQNYESDWSVCYWLIGVCEVQLFDESSAEDAFRFAQETLASRNWKGNQIPVFLAEHNLLLISQQGTGPRKKAAGEFGELLTYDSGRGGKRIPSVVIAGQNLETPTVLESVTWQAQTRGGRPLDSVLKGQAQFKKTGQEIGEVGAAAGTAILLSGDGHHDEGQVLVGGALLAAGAISWGISSLIRPQADTREWSSLPESIAVTSARIDAETVDLEIRYPDRAPILQTGIELPKSGDGVNVVLLFSP